MQAKADPKKAIPHRMVEEWIHPGEDWDSLISQTGWSTPDLQPLTQMESLDQMVHRTLDFLEVEDRL